ncbi:hypothetical protein ABMA28_001380 [Loxostege sticticalis]|uniref:Integrase catalytic domain-containing protein n=1 Tax=Loxostege sticticalis TaxID=481309 RepID=A0ABD0T5M8_LOXSC
MDKDEEINARRRFELDLRLFYNARCKKPEWTQQRIGEVINYIEEYEAAPRLNVKRNSNHYYYANHYDVMQVGGEKYLALKRKSTTDPIIKILPSEEYYNALSEIHKNTGHGGRDKMLHTLKSQYYIPTPVVISVSEPIISNSFNNRGQVDLKDLQSTPDREYKLILHYQDLTTKFSFLRPLTSKRAAEVALELLNFGNGREFTASIIKELIQMWPSCKKINGRPRHPASQGSVERANQDVENMLQAWLQDNNCTNWSIGIRFVQYQKNCSFHRTIKITPYKALFVALFCYGYGSRLLCYLCNSEKNIQDQTDKVAENLRKAAQKMKSHSSQKFPDIDVGSSVLMEIPKIERKVIEKRNESHEIGTSVGILKDWLPRNAIQISNITLEICQKLLRFGSQGYLECSCKKSNIQFSTKRCACKKHAVLCNSRCHDSSSCLIKN